MATQIGKVKWFDKEKGLGVIEGENGEEVFVEYSGITDSDTRELDEGLEVVFNITEGRRGKQAVNVEVKA